MNLEIGGVSLATQTKDEERWPPFLGCLAWEMIPPATALYLGLLGPWDPITAGMSGALHGHVHLCGFLRLHLHRKQLCALHRCTLAKQKVGHLLVIPWKSWGSPGESWR